MKSIVLSFIFAVATLSVSQANTGLVAPTPDPIKCIFAKSKAKLASSTLIILETNEVKFGDLATIGQNIRCRVRSNVYATDGSGDVVIRSNASAYGRIANIIPSTTNGEMLIMIQMFNVQTVDGQQIALDGNEQTIKARTPGEMTNINPMITITSQNVNNEIIYID